MSEALGNVMEEPVLDDAAEIVVAAAVALNRDGTQVVELGRNRLPVDTSSVLEDWDGPRTQLDVDTSPEDTAGPRRKIFNSFLV